MFLATGDCDATVRRVADNGGTVVIAPMDIPGPGPHGGRQGPGGAQFGLNPDLPEFDFTFSVGSRPKARPR